MQPWRGAYDFAFTATTPMSPDDARRRLRRTIIALLVPASIAALRRLGRTIAPSRGRQRRRYSASATYASPQRRVRAGIRGRQHAVAESPGGGTSSSPASIIELLAKHHPFLWEGKVMSLLDVTTDLLLRQVCCSLRRQPPVTKSLGAPGIPTIVDEHERISVRELLRNDSLTAWASLQPAGNEPLMCVDGMARCCAALTKAKDFSGLVRVMRYCDLAEVRGLAAMSIGNLASIQDPTGRKGILDAGSVSAVVEMVQCSRRQQHATDDMMMMMLDVDDAIYIEGKLDEAAAFVIANLSLFEHGRQSLFKYCDVIVPMLVQMVTRVTSDYEDSRGRIFLHLSHCLQTMACHNAHVAGCALRNLAAEMKFKAPIAKAGGIKALIQLLEDTSTLSNSFHNDKEFSSSISLNANFMYGVVATKNEGKRKAVIVGALRNLAIKSELCRDIIQQNGGIPLLIQILQQQEHVAVGSATTILGQEAAATLALVVQNNEVNKQLLTEHGGIPPLINLVLREVQHCNNRVSAENRTISLYAAVALIQLGSGSKDRTAIIKRHGGIQPLIKLLDHFSNNSSAIFKDGQDILDGDTSVASTACQQSIHAYLSSAGCISAKVQALR